jgi:hypothetical protein
MCEGTPVVHLTEKLVVVTRKLKRGVSVFGWKKHHGRAGALPPQKQTIPVLRELDDNDLLAVIGGQTLYPSQTITWLIWRSANLRNLRGR